MLTRNTLFTLFIALSTLLAGSAAVAATGGAFASGSDDPGHGNGDDNPGQGNASEQQPNENSEAEIDATFGPDCTSFTVESSKDISFVSINNETDFTYVKYEGEELRERDEGNSSDARTFAYSGDEEIKSIVVKSGTTTLVFNCPDGGGEVDADPDEQPECSDGQDNDGDGAVDHPEDPGCETPDDDDERDPDDAGDGPGGPPDDDQDDDGVPDDKDNCPDTANPDQADSDGDGEGDACDETPDGGGNETATQCSGNGDPIAVAIGGESSANESAQEDDNVLDVNVQSDSEHESDCDNFDVDAGTHNSSANNDSDDVDADVGTNNDAVGDNDGLDADVVSNSTAVTDNDGLDADVGSESEAEEDQDDGDVDVPPA